ncbi:MAG: helix-turn-helix domain-containing protein [Bdellovibrionales bacterium]|jgi:putative transcriptional regulator|nr:helix-turn-helix domain-containing protein [Bdellovibrionales bacterium]
MRLLNTLKKNRRYRNITQQELADSTSTTRQSIHSIENNKSVPSVSLAILIADYLKLNVEDLFYFDKKKSDQEIFRIF